MEIVIIGHKNPDTDSALGAIAYTELKKQTDLQNKFIGAVAGEINNETKFILNYFNIPFPQIMNDLSNWNGRIILLDHTEISQSPLGLDEAKIDEFLDHHRLGGMQTPNQVYARIEPIGSTSTIIAKIFKEKEIIPTKEIAGLMISGIISDTLFLKSSTTTKDDKDIILWLNDFCKIENLEEYASKMFVAKSNLSGISISEIVTKDYKEFDFNNKKVGIGVWETVDPKTILNIKDKLVKELINLKIKEKLNLVYFLIVDILHQQGEMIIIGKEEQKVAEDVFNRITKNNILPMGNIVSRKKEVVPPLEEYLK